MKFQDYTPVVMFFSSEEKSEECDAFEERWTHLQKEEIGAAYYRVSKEANTGIFMRETRNKAPYFKVFFKDMTSYKGDGSDWTKVRNKVHNAIKTADQDVNRTRESYSPLNEDIEDVTEDYINQIAE